MIEIPAGQETVEIAAGYTSAGGMAVASTSAARLLLFDAYAAGAAIDFINEPDRTGLRITSPRWALPMLTERLPGLFQEVPSASPEPRAARSSSAPPDAADFKAKVEEEIRNALLGSAVPNPSYSTDDAFILFPGPVPPSLTSALAAIPKRGSASKPVEASERLSAERTLRFKSDLPVGAVIFASPVAGVYYRQWYLMLLLDRLIRRIVPLPLKTALPLTVRPYYYRMELAVLPGQFPEPAEESLLQEIQRLQFTPARTADLEVARQDAIAYLDAQPVRDWFASHDMMSRRDEGVQWIQAMSADDLRAAARDLLIMNRVIATWAPKPRQTSVTAEPLVSSGAVNDHSVRVQTAGAGLSMRTTSFPPHKDALPLVPLAETLSSGVSIVVSAIDAVFVSGISMTRFDQEFTADDLKLFQQYRPDRILVLSKPSSMDGARRLWSGFKGGSNAQGVLPRGRVPVADLPALAVLKTILDLRLIDAGWWPDASVRLDAGEGAGLQIHASDEQRAQIMEWIQALGTTRLPQSYFDWVREVAVHRFDRIRADLQALTWERDPQRLLGDPAMVTPDEVQRVARSYF